MQGASSLKTKPSRAPEGEDGRLGNVIKGEAIKLQNAGKNALPTGAILIRCVCRVNLGHVINSATLAAPCRVKLTRL